jgi:ferrous iron transport protein B
MVDGVIAGVGGVMAFVPVLMSLYLALAVLEDTGYMARAAFVMDRLMRVLGLHGKSFLPLLVGFGCSVPGIYATRTLEHERDRILTGLLVPFMSCGARLPVYMLFAAVFFPRHGGTVVFALYLTGIGTAVLLGVLLKRTLFRHKPQMPFVMELPPYRRPTLRGLWTHMWCRTRSFVRKAWTVILVMSILIWALMAVPLGGGGRFGEVDVADSAFAGMAEAISPAFSPLGFDSWQTTGALVSGLVAKEVVVSSLAQVYRVEDEGLAEEAETHGWAALAGDLRFAASGFARATAGTVRAVLGISGSGPEGAEGEAQSSSLMSAVRAGFEETSGGHGRLAALAFMVFVLLYTPCMVALAAERQEFGTRWMAMSMAGQLALAWLAAFAVFQGGRLLGLG